MILPFSLSLREKVQSSSLGHSSRLPSMKAKGSIFSSFSFPQSNQILTILSSPPAKVTPRGCRRIAMKWRWIAACSSFQPHTYKQHDVFPHRLIAGQCLTLISYQWVAWDFDIADIRRPQRHRDIQHISYLYLYIWAVLLSSGLSVMCCDLIDAEGGWMEIPLIPAQLMCFSLHSSSGAVMSLSSSFSSPPPSPCTHFTVSLALCSLNFSVPCFYLSAWHWF